MKIKSSEEMFYINQKPVGASANPYDLDIDTTALSLGHNRGDLAPITSESLCTPGCGNTGTFNSFCC